MNNIAHRPTINSSIILIYLKSKNGQRRFSVLIFNSPSYSDNSNHYGSVQSISEDISGDPID